MKNESVLPTFTLEVCQLSGDAAHDRPLHEGENPFDGVGEWLVRAVQLTLVGDDVAIVNGPQEPQLPNEPARRVGAVRDRDDAGRVEILEVIQLAQKLWPPLRRRDEIDVPFALRREHEGVD